MERENDADRDLHGSAPPAPQNPAVSSDPRLQATLDDAKAAKTAPSTSACPAPTAQIDRFGAPMRDPALSATDTLHFPTIDGYRIIGKLGEGGMGVVWKAIQISAQRPVALKLASAASLGSERARMRFQREVELTARLEHANIARVYDGGECRGICFYAMEFIEGIPLDRYIKATKLPRQLIVELMAKVCRAVEHAHQKAILHRDLKPANILVDQAGQPHVLDFGLAKAMEGDQQLTIDGAVAGTPVYMSPEQAAGRHAHLDTRSDVYTLGVILFSLLTGQFPHDTSGTCLDVMKRIAELEPRRLKDIEPRPDKDLAAILTKSLNHDAERRYGTAGGLAADLGRYLQGDPIEAQPPTMRYLLVRRMKKHRLPLGVLAAVLVLLLGTGVWAYVRVTIERNAAVRANDEKEKQRQEAVAQRMLADENERRANRAIADLRKSAPTFFEQAKLLTDRAQLPEALDKIEIALTLNPDQASFHAQAGNILQSLERFGDAADAYSQAVRLNPQEPHAAANIALSRMLAGARGKDGALSVNMRMRWRDELSLQGRYIEAILAGKGTATDAAKMLPAWQAKLDAWLGAKAPRLRLASDGLYILDLSNLSLTDLSPIRGMPVENLNLDGNPHLRDLGPLADCPLLFLDANQITDLVDLSPLNGKNLKTLQIAETGIQDLRPLAGMRALSFLNIAKDAISDLAPIRQAAMKRLIASNTGLKSLEPLRGQPLDNLSIHQTLVGSLDPVGDAPLTFLDISYCRDLDLADLRTRQLRWLYADFTTLDHYELISQMTELENITLPRNLVDPGILRKLTHLRKIDTHANSDVEKLTDAGVFWRAYDARRAAAVTK